MPRSAIMERLRRQRWERYDIGDYDEWLKRVDEYATKSKEREMQWEETSDEQLHGPQIRPRPTGSRIRHYSHLDYVELAVRFETALRKASIELRNISAVYPKSGRRIDEVVDYIADTLNDAYGADDPPGWTWWEKTKDD